MNHKQGDNGVNTPNPVVVDNRVNQALFDAMPKPVRLALIEAKYDYGAEQVWAAFNQAFEDLKFEVGSYATPWGAWQRVLRMIAINDRETAKLERKMYDDLVVELRAERDARIERAFQKLS